MDYNCEEQDGPNAVGLLVWAILLGIAFFGTSLLMGASLLVAIALYTLGGILGLCFTAALCMLRSKPCEACGGMGTFPRDRPTHYQHQRKY